MAVELRCPDCRAKLRLAEAPEPGVEVECPKCQTVFPAPDPDTGEVPDDRSRKKRPDDGADRPADKPKPARKPGADPKATPKKRKAKKQKTNKALLYTIVAVAVVFVGAVGGLLYWFFNRQPAAMEMMSYLPEDCWTASGGNIGHLQKYPEFFQRVEALYSGQPFVSVAGAFGDALGQKTNDYLDSVVTGSTRGGGGYTVVLRTKKEFDPGVLAKLPAAREVQADGGKYYQANVDGQSVRAFAPTRRLVVFAAAGVPEGTLRTMMKANKGNEDKTLPGRAGALARRTVRGTAWVFFLLEAGDKPAVREEGAGGGLSGDNALRTHGAALLSAAKGVGMKASVGSRSVRAEVIFQYPDSDKAAEQYKKFKDSSLAKGDEEDPPKWWKELGNQVGNKKVQAELLSNVSATSSGELFIYYSQVDTKLMLEVVQGVGGKAMAINGFGDGSGSGGGPPAGIGGGPGGQGR
ncbi:MAG: zinc-ribbon domain-containing protein, partial [Gemmataceae bacterium]|nr:zinc-ribbon domain-containing protein [Gemmataceae bacterium]